MDDSDGATLAEFVLARCENDYESLKIFFGGITPPNLPFNVVIKPGIPGASHDSCAATTLYCDAVTDSDMMNMLVVAEEVEVFQAAQGIGWDCGTTNGEGLSRVLAEALYPGASIVIANYWLNSNRPNYVTANEPSPLANGQLADQDSVSNACSVLFLNWLHTQLGFGWDNITQAGAQSLAQTYTNLTGQANAFTKFAALLDQHFPEGQEWSITTNNPISFALTVGSRLFYARQTDSTVGPGACIATNRTFT